MTIFGLALGSFLHPRTPPGQCCDPKWTNFHPFCSKFKEGEGWGEDASFTNIAGKGPTLLNSFADLKTSAGEANNR